MKTFIKTIAIAIVAMVFGFNSANAQSKTGNTLEGVWVMDKIVSDGKKEAFVCGDSYSRVKIYGKGGEYCCAEIIKGKNGSVTVLPHEYGTYSYINGKYTECGRECGDDAINFSDKDSFHGRWKNTTEYWNRNTKFPSELSKHILKVCKITHDSKNNKIQTMLTTNFFNKK